MEEFLGMAVKTLEVNYNHDKFKKKKKKKKN